MLTKIKIKVKICFCHDVKKWYIYGFVYNNKSELPTENSKDIEKHIEYYHGNCFFLDKRCKWQTYFVHTNSMRNSWYPTKEKARIILNKWKKLNAIT